MPIVASAVAGCLAGITVSFVLGRRVGLPTLRRRLHGILWSTVFVSLGYYAGDHWRQIIEVARGHLIVMAVVVTAAAVIVGSWQAMIARRP